MIIGDRCASFFYLKLLKLKRKLKLIRLVFRLFVESLVYILHKQEPRRTCSIHHFLLKKMLLTAKQMWYVVNTWLRIIYQILNLFLKIISFNELFKIFSQFYQEFHAKVMKNAFQNVIIIRNFSVLALVKNQ